MNQMPIEQQVTSRELSQELEKAGYPQEEGIFHWVNLNNDWVLWYYKEHWMHTAMEKEKGLIGGNFPKYFIAPTVCELGEVLSRDANQCAIDFYKDDGKWVCHAFSGKHIGVLVREADTEANVRAKTILYLIKEGLLKL